MKRKDGMKDSSAGQTLDRRTFIISAGAAFAAHSLGRRAYPAVQGTSGRMMRAYVGTYTGAVGAGSNGEGIYVVDANPTTGELSNLKLAAKTPSPSWIAIQPSNKYLYAVNEIENYHGDSGSVSAFSINDSDGTLTDLNVVSSEGAGPCFLSIDAQGKFAFVANYNSGTTAVLPILEDGRLGPAADVHHDTGSLGSARAANAPQGSYAVSGHDGPHAHMIAPDPSGKFVLATDLGQDRIYAYRFDRSSGKLTAPQTASLPSGDGPRHFAFHPHQHWLFVIQEEASNVVRLDFDPDSATLTARQTISVLPPGFAGTSFASEVLVSPDGRFLYAANRLHDSIAVLSIAPDGTLKWIGEVSTLGDYPGQCRINPQGSFLYACNRKSDSITCFKIDEQTGRLSFTGQYTGVGSAASITFMS
jgi:6-phosphogluconolactonase